MLAQRSILHELRRAEAELAAASEQAARHPEDFLVTESVLSFAQHVEELRLQWEEECLEERVEVCKYRVISDEPDFQAHDIGASISRFQDLFTHLYAALQSGPREGGRLPQAFHDTTGLRFGYSYAGSLGIAFYIPSEARLFDEGFDDTVDALHQVFQISDEFELRDMARLLGKPAVSRIKEWASVHERAGLEVDIVWRNNRGEYRGGLISGDQIRTVRELIDVTSDADHKDEIVQGRLIGLDVEKRKFNFKAGKREFQGNLADSFDVTEQYEINALFEAEIRTTTVVYYGRNDSKETIWLQCLKPMATL